MNRKNLNGEMVSAAARVLQPMFPELNPQELVNSLAEVGKRKNEPEAGKMLSVKEYCRRIGCSKPTAFRHIREGKIMAIKLGGLTRIPETEIMRLIRVYQKVGGRA